MEPHDIWIRKRGLSLAQAIATNMVEMNCGTTLACMRDWVDELGEIIDTIDPQDLTEWLKE